MQTKEIVVRMDADTQAILSQEVTKRRTLGVANSITDIFLIRLMEAISCDSKVLLLKKERNTLIARKYPTLNYDTRENSDKH